MSPYKKTIITVQQKIVEEWKAVTKNVLNTNLIDNMSYNYRKAEEPITILKVEVEKILFLLHFLENRTKSEATI
jgi:hypothetical protein